MLFNSGVDQGGYPSQQKSVSHPLRDTWIQMQSGYTTTYKEYWTLAWFLWVLEVLPCTLGLVTLCNMSAHRQWGGSPATTSDPSPYSPTSSGFDLLGIFWGNLYQQSGPGIWCLHDRILPELYWVRWIPLSQGHLGPSFGNMLTLFEMPQNLLPSHQSYNLIDPVQFFLHLKA